MFASIFPSLYYPLLSFSSLNLLTPLLLPLFACSLSCGAWHPVGVLLTTLVKGEAGLQLSGWKSSFLKDCCR